MSPRRRLLALLLLIGAVIAPQMLVAQGGMGGMGGFGGRGGGGGGRGGMGGGGGRMGGMSARRPEAPAINTVDLILKHGHDLQLTDSQVTRLTVVKARQDSVVKLVRARMDSIAPGGRGGAMNGEDPSSEPNGGGSGNGRDLGATQERAEARGEVMKSYRDALKHGRDDAWTVLEKKQRKQTEKLEKELKKEMEEEMGDGAGGGMRGGRQGGTAGYPFSR